MTESRIFTLCRMITWVVFLRMFWNLISSLPVKRGGSLSFLVGTISNILVMEIGWTDVGSGGYILVSCAHSNTSLQSVQHFHVVTTCEFSICYTIILWFFTKFKYLQIMTKLFLNSLSFPLFLLDQVPFFPS